MLTQQQFNLFTGKMADLLYTEIQEHTLEHHHTNAFMDDVAAKEDFEKAINGAVGLTDVQINRLQDGAFNWADASAQEAFARGFNEALKLMGGGAK